MIDKVIVLSKERCFLVLNAFNEPIRIDRPSSDMFDIMHEFYVNIGCDCYGTGGDEELEHVVIGIYCNQQHLAYYFGILLKNWGYKDNEAYELGLKHWSEMMSKQK